MRPAPRPVRRPPRRRTWCCSVIRSNSISRSKAPTLWYLRLCRSVVASAGGQLTGALDTHQRRALGRELLSMPSHVAIVPVADLAWQMAERHTDFALSTLSCEALVVAERLDASICVWLGDDGPNLRAASQALGIAYRTIVNGP